MNGQPDVRALNERIQSLRQTAEELKQISGGFPAVERNVWRILAAVRMLELNVSDLPAERPGP